MSKQKKLAYIGKECVACGRCISECPIGAVTVYRGINAVADEDKCVGCGKCAKACPAGVIEVTAREVETA